MNPENLTTEQIENIQIDYGLVFLNYGEQSQAKLGPTRGGGEFTASKNIQDIEFDGRRGKTKGLQYIDEMNAMLKFSVMDTSLATIAMAMPQADLVTEGEAPNQVTKIKNRATGIIPDSKYLKNVTMFGKVLGGKYKKITIYNALNEKDFVLNAAPKGQGVVEMEVYAHWDPKNVAKDIYTIEDIEAIAIPE